MNKFRSFIKFIRNNLWSVPEHEISKFNHIVLGQVRVISLALKGAGEDKIFQKASALTYYTLWALVPVLSMLFGVAKGFGFQENINAFLTKQFASQPEVANQIIQLVNKYLDSIKGGVFVGIGIIILLWSVINVLSQVEVVFNDIWQNKKSRTFLRKFTDYFALFILVPVFIVVSSGVNIFIVRHLNNVVNMVGLSVLASPIQALIAKTIPYVLYITLFTMLYLVIPNTNVKFKSAIIPGIIIGFLFQILQMLYFSSHVWFGRMHTVYSGLVALPLLLLFAQIGWSIVLIGAEISFAHQNIKNFMYNDQIANISTGYRQKLTLFIVHVVAKRFKEGLPPYTAEQIADQYNIPIRLMNRLLFQLTETNLLNEISIAKHKDIAYQPAVDINLLTVSYVSNKLDMDGTHDFVPIEKQEFSHLNQILAYKNSSMEHGEFNSLLVDL